MVTYCGALGGLWAVTRDVALRRGFLGPGAHVGIRSSVTGGPNAGGVVCVPVMGRWVCARGDVPGRGAGISVWAWRFAVLVVWGGRLLRFARDRQSQGMSLASDPNVAQ